MNARLVAVMLLALLGVLHGQLWWGRGSVPQVNGLREDLIVQNQANAQAQQRNEQLANEVRDLREGLDMVEEMARQELGMVKPNEIFVQVQRSAP
jgi:cell division protein FtsB